MKFLLSAFYLLFVPGLLWAQPPVVHEWAKSVGGPGNDGGMSVVADKDGYVYSTGYFSGTVDFNPGAGVFNLSSNGINDIYILKLDSKGNFVWAINIGGKGTEVVFSIALDGQGNPVIAGTFNDTVDFDHGTGVHKEYPSDKGVQDVFVAKYNHLGNFEWVDRFGTKGVETIFQMKTDLADNIYCTGSFNGTVDFDPGPGVYNLTLVNYDIVILKLSSSGGLIWAKSMGSSTYNEIGFAIDIDTVGNVYSTGIFFGTVDFDPGPGVYNLSCSTGRPANFILKLDKEGDFVWAKTVGISASDEKYYSIAVDKKGRVNVYSIFNLYADYDPGTGFYPLTPSVKFGYFDGYLLQLDKDGNFLWASSFGNELHNLFSGMDVDDDDNIYLTGGFQKTIDFDAGLSSTYYLNSVGFYDIFVVKLNSSGKIIWAKSVGGKMGERGVDIYVDKSKNVYTTGNFGGAVDFDFYEGTSDTLYSKGISDLFVHKMKQSPVSGPPANIPGDGVGTHEIGIFPNPNNGIFSVVIPGNNNGNAVFIYNSMGSLIYTKSEVEALSKINLSGQASGVYFIKIKSAESEYSIGKIIKL